jgi:hypothetical protein
VSTAPLLCVTLLLAACARGPEPTPEEAGRAAMDTLRAAAATVVKDPARAKEVTAAVDEMKQVFGEAFKAAQAHAEKLRALDASYDTTPAEVRSALADYNAARAQRQARLAAARDRMAVATTDAEWEQLAKARRAALESLVKPR